MNISKTISEGINILKENEIRNPQLDAEILLSKLIKKDKKYLILNPEEVVSSEKLDIFKKLIERIFIMTICQMVFHQLVALLGDEKQI